MYWNISDYVLNWQWALINSFGSNSNGNKNSTSGASAWLTDPCTVYLEFGIWELSWLSEPLMWRSSVYRVLCFYRRILIYWALIRYLYSVTDKTPLFLFFSQLSKYSSFQCCLDFADRPSNEQKTNQQASRFIRFFFKVLSRKLDIHPEGDT